jgi:hypothetical protein
MVSKVITADRETLDLSAAGLLHLMLRTRYLSAGQAVRMNLSRQMPSSINLPQVKVIGTSQ